MNIELDIPYRLSRWSHQFFREGFEHFALFHSLNIETLYLEHKFKDIIISFRSGITLQKLLDNLTGISQDEFLEVAEELVRTGLIVPVFSDDRETLKEKQEEVIPPSHIETLYLLVTDECNLRCKYCFINNCMPLGYNKTFMTWDTAKNAVDMFFTNLKNNPPECRDLYKTIVFYGGEPLLNFSVIKQVVEYVKTEYAVQLKEMDGTFQFSIITNGVAITNEVAKFLGEHSDIIITLSLDGTKEIHDAKRITPNGKGSFDMAIKGLTLLREVGGRNNVAVSCTIDDHNIDHLHELLELHDKYDFVAINLNPLVETVGSHIDENYPKKVSERMLEYFVVARERGVYEERVMRKAMAFINKTIHAFDCQATGSQIVCSPDGKLGVCQEGLGTKNFFFGEVSTKWSFFEEPVLTEWGKRTPLNMPQCYDCPALGICGGGCTYNAWLKNGSIWGLDDKFCVHSLTTLEWLIWDSYANL